MIDLRSDTVTKPTPEMKQFMMNCELGDDVFSEDPSINELEAKAAKMFGKDAGLFCASGTMTNQIAINVHSRPGDEIICHRLSHVYNYEGGGIAFNSGASVRLIEGNRGNISTQDVIGNINEDDVHKPITSLVCLEDTCNKAGGAVLDFDMIKATRKTCLENNLKTHLDGARLFNRLVASPQDYLEYGNQFDSISLCMSKGLGAPVGSVLIGSTEFINKARRVRKVFGGGMRQGGIIASAGLYALENHINRLAEDHGKAKVIEERLIRHPKVESVLPVETNIVVFKLKEEHNPHEFVADLESNGIRSFVIGEQSIRFVFHLDVSEAEVESVAQILDRI